MSKYIDADMLEKDGWNIERIRQVSSTEMVYETKKPTDFPAADVVEVKRGRWEVVDKGHGFSDWKCSVCGGSGRGDYLICPWCGARMDEVEE